MRIAYAHTGNNTYDRFFLGLLSQEHDVCLLTFSRRPREVPTGVSIVRIPDLGWPIAHRNLDRLRIALAQMSRALAFKRCVKRMSPDVLIGNYISTYGLYSALSGWHPFALFAWGSDIVQEPQISPFHRCLAKYVVNGADLVLVDSDIQESAALQLGAKSGSILKIPWFNPSEYDNVIKDSRFREMLGWREKIVVVCTRMHEKRYRIDTFLRAAALVLKENQKARFLVCGTGSQTLRLNAIAKDLDLGHAVHFVGFLPRRQLVGVVQDCDVYVSTSEADGSSASLLEAMTAGLPCIVTDIPGNREWIEDARNGLLFKVGDHRALASAILRLSANGDLRASLGESAAWSVRHRIKWEVNSNSLLGKLVALTEAKAGSR